jgi:hypothetical protein
MLAPAFAPGVVTDRPGVLARTLTAEVRVNSGFAFIGVNSWIASSVIRDAPIPRSHTRTPRFALAPSPAPHAQSPPASRLA